MKNLLRYRDRVKTFTKKKKTKFMQIYIKITSGKYQIIRGTTVQENPGTCLNLQKKKSSLKKETEHCKLL